MSLAAISEEHYKSSLLYNLIIALLAGFILGDQIDLPVIHTSSIDLKTSDILSIIQICISLVLGYIGIKVSWQLTKLANDQARNVSDGEYFKDYLIMGCTQMTATLSSIIDKSNPKDSNLEDVVELYNSRLSYQASTFMANLRQIPGVHFDDAPLRMQGDTSIGNLFSDVIGTLETKLSPAITERTLIEIRATCWECINSLETIQFRVQATTISHFSKNRHAA